MDLKNFTDKTLIEKLEQSDSERNDIQKELEARGYEIEYKEGIKEKEAISRKQESKFSRSLPIIFGLFFICIALVRWDLGINEDEQIGLAIFLNIIIRIICINWIINIANKLQSKKVGWGILGLLFGGWALCLIGIIYYIFGDLRD